MIEFRDVNMTYKAGISALKNVSFKIMDGEFVFVIGKSGSGKSTLIKLLTCEENPSSGSVLIDDYEISYLRRNLIPYLRRNIGMIFQDFRLIHSKTVYENVAFAMEIIGASRKNIKTRVPIVLSIVGLRHKAKMKPYQLSGGEQQRVAIARAMVNNPMLILADEPTGNLDPVNSESIMALLEEINCSGTTIIVCTHDSSIVNKMKRRVFEISDGRIVRDDKLGEYNIGTCPVVMHKKPGDSLQERKKDKKESSAAKREPFVRNINIKLNREDNFQRFRLGADETITDEIFSPANEMHPVIKKEESIKDETLNENKEKNDPEKKIAEKKSALPENEDDIMKKVYDYYSLKASEYMGESEENNSKKKKEDDETFQTVGDFNEIIVPRRVKSEDKSRDDK